MNVNAVIREGVRQVGASVVDEVLGRIKIERQETVAAVRQGEACFQ